MINSNIGTSFVYERRSKVCRVVDNSSEIGRRILSIPLASKEECLVEQGLIFFIMRFISTGDFIFLSTIFCG